MACLEMIVALQNVPYAPGKGTFSGADCWGIVELWYKHVLGLVLNDRAEHPVGHKGVQSGFRCAMNWQKIDRPEDHCLVILREGGFEAGHVGVFYNGDVLHSSKAHGCVLEPLKRLLLKSQVTCFLRHK